MTSFLGGSGTLAELVWSLFVLVGTIVLFFVGWRVVSRLAQRHAEADPRARSKAVAAVLVSLLLGVGGFVMLANFEAKSEVGLHTTFVKALNQTVGEGDYLEAYKSTFSKPLALGIQQGKLAAAKAALAANPDNASAAKDIVTFSAAINQTNLELATAQATLRILAANHAVWQLVQPHLLANTHAGDEQARGILDAALDPTRITTILPADVACQRDASTLAKQPQLAGFCIVTDGQTQPAAIEHSFRDLHTLQQVPVAEGVPEAYTHLDQFRAQMRSTLSWFVYPGITGLFLAPFAVAGGSILNAAYEPSATVGFKPYPGKAAGLFLLLGAFGVFAIPFGAWTLRDLHKRSLEGQIAL